MTRVDGAAFVTGAARGIGLSIATSLAQKGFSVAMNDLLDDEKLDLAVRQVQFAGAPRVVKIPGDIAEISLQSLMLHEAEEALGPLSTLVNNAGVSVMSRGDLLDVSEASYDRCMAINAKAQFFLSQTFARRLLNRTRNDGRFYSLINVTSSNAVAVAVQRSEYCVSKAAAAMVAKTLAVRLGKESIAVYDIQPGLIETDMTLPVRAVYQRRIDEEGLTLLPRMGQPDDIGRIAATLASGELPYTTGHVISADAGMLVSRF